MYARRNSLVSAGARSVPNVSHVLHESASESDQCLCGTNCGYSVYGIRTGTPRPVAHLQADSYSDRQSVREVACIIMGVFYCCFSCCYFLLQFLGG